MARAGERVAAAREWAAAAAARATAGWATAAVAGLARAAAEEEEVTAEVGAGVLHHVAAASCDVYM